MTVKEVAQIVHEIKTLAVDDYERAHGMEDSLYIGVLRAIAEDRCRSPRAIAAEALKPSDIEFNRYCA